MSCHDYKIINILGPIFNFAINLNICFTKKNNEVMVTKALVRNCNCTHCTEKSEQINRSRTYWDKVIIKKLNI